MAEKSFHGNWTITITPCGLYQNYPTPQLKEYEYYRYRVSHVYDLHPDMTGEGDTCMAALFKAKERIRQVEEKEDE